MLAVMVKRSIESQVKQIRKRVDKLVKTSLVLVQIKILIRYLFKIPQTCTQQMRILPCMLVAYKPFLKKEARSLQSKLTMT